MRKKQYAKNDQVTQLFSDVINYMGGPNVTEVLINGRSVICIGLGLGTFGFKILKKWEYKTGKKAMISQNHPGL